MRKPAPSRPPPAPARSSWLPSWLWPTTFLVYLFVVTAITAGLVISCTEDLVRDQFRLQRDEWTCRRSETVWRTVGRNQRQQVEECALWERRAPDGTGG